MTERHDWAEALIEDSILEDGSHREIRLPSAIRYRHGWPTPDTDAVRRHVLAAVARGRLLQGPAELLCPESHVVWAGPLHEVEAARRKGCPMCAGPVAPERLLLEETFTIPDVVAREVADRRRT